MGNLYPLKAVRTLKKKNKRETETERQRQKDRDRETETDRETDRHIERQRQRDRQRQRETQTQTDRQRDRQREEGGWRRREVEGARQFGTVASDSLCSTSDSERRECGFLLSPRVIHGARGNAESHRSNYATVTAVRPVCAFLLI